MSANRRSFAVLGIALASCSLLSCASRPSGWRLSGADERAARACIEQFRVAWLANDPNLVLAVFTDGGILLPPGIAPVVGKDAIREHWWPKSQPPTTITGFTISVDEASGYDNLAVIRGHDVVKWTTSKGKASIGRSRFVSTLERQSGGSWRIRSQAWAAE